MEVKQETAVRTHGMKAKTIKGIVRRKIDNWIETIEDKSLQTRVKQGVILTGGSIASMLIGQDVNDFDVYFRDHDTALASVDTAYFVQLLERMKEKDPEKVDAAYLIEIIDRIF